MVTVDDFLNSDHFLILSSLDSSLIQEYLNEAAQDCDRMMPAGEWGNRYNRAIKVLAAHRLTMLMNNQSGVAIAGAVSNLNVSNGAQSVGFGGGAASADDPEALQTTVFGREFALMRKAVPWAGFTI